METDIKQIGQIMDVVGSFFNIVARAENTTSSDTPETIRLQNGIRGNILSLQEKGRRRKNTTRARKKTQRSPMFGHARQTHGGCSSSASRGV